MYAEFITLLGHLIESPVFRGVCVARALYVTSIIIVCLVVVFSYSILMDFTSFMTFYLLSYSFMYSDDVKNIEIRIINAGLL